MKIIKGQIIIYRMFDVGEEINLRQADESLQLTKKERSKLKPKTFLVKDPPIQLELGVSKIQLKSREVKASIEAKFWNYGVVSLQMIIDIKDMEISEITKFGIELENSSEIEEFAKSKIKEIFKTVKPHIANPAIWDTYEDYNLFFFTEIDGTAKDLLIPEIANLLLLDEESLSQSTVDDVLKRNYQYGKNDLTMINWNSAVVAVLDKTDNKEIPDIIEFALTHLLEMRFYDELLDEQLDVLYHKINSNNVFSNLFYNMSKKTSKRYIELSEFIDRVENSIKTVGDSYLAFIFRTANKEFRVEPWQVSIKSKMDDLYRITDMIQGEINHTRAMILESVIVLWAIYEVSISLLGLK